MNRQTLSIGVLSVTAALLFVAQFLPLQPAVAGETIKDRDYTMVTATNVSGGDALYVTDNRSGQMAVFTWDAGARTLRVRAVRSIADAFAAQ